MNRLDHSTGQQQESSNTFQIRRLVKQSSMLLTSGALSYAGGLLLNVILARALGVVGFGAWAIAFSTTLTLSAIALLGADWIIIRNGSFFESMQDHLRLRRLIHIALAFGGTSLVVAGGGLFVIAPIVARDVFHDLSVTPLLRLAGITVPVIGIQQIMLSGTRAFKSVNELVYISNLAQPLVRVLAVSVALAFVPTRVSAFTGLLVAELFVAGAAVIALNNRIRLIGPTSHVSLRETMSFGVPAWGTRLLENLRKDIFPILLGSLSGFAAGGAYVASRRVSSAPSSIITSLLRVYTPIASDLYLQKRRNELLNLFQSLGKWSFALAFPLFCFLVAFPKEILSLFGQAFTDASAVLVVLAFGMLFLFGTGPVTVTLILSGHPKLALADYLIVVAMEIGIALWLVPDLGVLGAAVAKLVGTAVNNLLPLVQVWRLERIQPYRLDYWKPLAAGITAVILTKAIVALSPLHSDVAIAAVAAPLLGSLYVAFVLVFRLTEEDRVAISTLALRKNSKDKHPATADSTVAD